jgi:hypothetical protein
VGKAQIVDMSGDIKIGDRVEVHLNEKTWGNEGWFAGIVVRIEPYSEHRSFYWVELNEEGNALPGKGTKLISVLNPKNIRKV